MAMNPRLLRPTATGFDPRTIAGLELWLNPAATSTLTLNGSTVSQMNDASGNGRHFVQATGGSQPGQTSVNGRNALTFNAQWMHQTALSAYANQTTIIVFSRRDGNNADNFAGIFGYRAANTGISGVSNSDVVFEFRARGGTSLPGTPTALEGATGESAFVNGSTATLTPGTFGTVAVREFTPCPVATANQLAVVSINTNRTANGSKMPLLGVEGFSTNRTYGMTFCELLVYSNQLTALQRLTVERYLGRKWGITVA
jgi:hypothetical protein